MTAELLAELSAVETYLLERESIRAEQLAWVARSMEEVFNA